MAEHAAEWFAFLPKEWVVLVIAMLPIVELRGSIPFALSPAMGPPLHWSLSYLLSCAGNLIPIIPILAFIGPVSDWLRQRSRHADRFFAWLFARTRRRGRVVKKYGAWGLVLFVAIPLPVTGGWTGAAAAFLFGVPFRKAFPCISLGVGIAGVVVTVLTLLARAGYHVLGF